MEKIKFLIAVVIVTYCMIAPFRANGDTTEESLNKKVEVVNDSVKTESLIIKDNNNSTCSHPLDKVLKAIISIESKGDPKAYNRRGDCVGILQIQKICVRECNRILKLQKKTKQYTYADRWDKEKSIEMFFIIQEFHNPKYDIHKAIKLWNPRPSYERAIRSKMKN